MWLFNLIIFSNIKTFFFKKTLIKSKYLSKIIIFLISNKVISAFLAKYNNIKLSLKKVIYITKRKKYISKTISVLILIKKNVL